MTTVSKMGLIGSDTNAWRGWDSNGRSKPAICASTLEFPATHAAYTICMNVAVTVGLHAFDHALFNHHSHNFGLLK